MKYFATIIATLFTLSTYAQEYNIGKGGETARMTITPYATAAEAEAANGAAVQNKYLRPIADWAQTEEQDVTIYKSQFAYPFAWLNRLALIHIDAVWTAYELYLNGKLVGNVTNGYAPAEFNVTSYVQDDMNSVEIRVAKTHWSQTLECFDNKKEVKQPNAYVFSQPVIRVRDITHKARVDATGKMANVEVGLVVKTEALNPKKARIHYELISRDTTVIEHGYRDIYLEQKGEDTVKFMARIPAKELWSIDSPTLYKVNIKTQIEGRYAEYQSHSIGFRELTYEDKKLLINGEKVELKISDVDAQTAQIDELKRLKKGGFNSVRVIAGTASASFYQMCDAAGMYVVVVAPINTSQSGTSRKVGGNPTNDIAWRTIYLDRTESAYRTTCDYASVVAYQLAQKSANGINLYESYLLLKELENERPIIYPDSGKEWNNDVIE